MTVKEMMFNIKVWLMELDELTRAANFGDMTIGQFVLFCFVGFLAIGLFMGMLGAFGEAIGDALTGKPAKTPLKQGNWEE